MKTSAAGRAAITRREGCVLRAYRDSRGIPTIGVGHVDMTPPKTLMGMVITRERADELLVADLGRVEAAINASVKVPLSQNEFDALASLGFNIGVGGLKRSSVVAKLNRGDVAGAAQAFLAWSKPAVLARRRREEKAQFLTPDPVVAQARAEKLADLSAASTRKTATPRNAGAAVLATGAAAATMTAGWHPVAAVVVGALAVVGFLVALAVGARRHAQAAAFAAHADAEARVAHGAILSGAAVAKA